jgi:flagellar hook-associated protein 2
MATISSAGIGSGLDVKSIITQLMAIEQQPKNQLVTAATKIQTQISEVGKVTSALSTLKDLSSKLSSSTFWNQTTASSSSTAVSVTSSSTALAANYSVEVQQLASSQSLMAGQTFTSSTAAVGTGTLNIEMGTWGTGQTTFTAASVPSSAAITVDSTDTVESLRDKINAAGIGVSASILTDSSGARLVVRSTSSGAANGFRVTPSGATGGVATMGYDPSHAVTGATQTKAAADAKATIDGVSVTASSNTFANVMDGVSLTANAVTTAAATVTVTNDTTTIKTTLQSFATAYTALNSLIATDTKYDATTKKAGPLQGDSTIVDVQTRMRTLLGATSTASSAFSRLSDAGLELQRDGSLTLNATKVDNALANISQMKALFVDNTSTSTSGEGFGKQFYDTAYSMLTTGGSINSRSTALSDKLLRNQKSQDAMDARLAQTQKMLEAQYSALDTRMASLTGLSSYVTQQVTQWNKTGA